MAITGKSSASEPKKVFDVAKPNQSAPDSTSKPLITGHKPLVEDPMVKEDALVSQLSPTDTHEQSEDKPKEKMKPPSVTKTVIKPLSEPSDDEKKDEKVGFAESDENSNDEDDKPPVGAVLKGGQTTKELQDAEITKQEKILSLVESGEYNVKLGTPPQHNKDEKLAWIIVAALIVVGVALYLAIDAELVNANVELPFELIQ